jgi:hypothetical protein
MFLVHIGLKKCASSSIQGFLGSNRRRLKKAGIVYPRFGRSGSMDRAHHNLANDLLNRAQFVSDLGTVAEALRQSRKWRWKVTVISSEVFEGAEAQHVAELRKILEDETVRVFMVVRDLLDQIRSSYAQKVRQGKHHFDFDSFFLGRLGQPRVDYFETARRWADVFGWESLHICALDRNYDIIAELLSTLDLDPASAEKELKLSRTEVQNASPGWRVLEAVRALYVGSHGLEDSHPLVKLARQPDKISRVGPNSLAIGQRRGWNTDRGNYLTAAQAKVCFDTYAAAVERLNLHLRRPLPVPLDLSARGFREREFLPTAAHIPPQELASFYDELWCSLPDRAKRRLVSEIEAPVPDP